MHVSKPGFARNAHWRFGVKPETSLSRREIEPQNQPIRQEAAFFVSQRRDSETVLNSLIILRTPTVCIQICRLKPRVADGPHLVQLQRRRVAEHPLDRSGSDLALCPIRADRARRRDAQEITTKRKAQLVLQSLLFTEFRLLHHVVAEAKIALSVLVFNFRISLLP